MTKPGPTGCYNKHLSLAGLMVGTVLLVCASLWAWTGGQITAIDGRLGKLERDTAAMQTEIRVQYEAMRRDLTEIKADLKELRKK